MIWWAVYCYICGFGFAIAALVALVGHRKASSSSTDYLGWMVFSILLLPVAMVLAMFFCFIAGAVVLIRWARMYKIERLEQLKSDPDQKFLSRRRYMNI